MTNLSPVKTHPNHTRAILSTQTQKELTFQKDMRIWRAWISKSPQRYIRRIIPSSIYWVRSGTIARSKTFLKPTRYQMTIFSKSKRVSINMKIGATSVLKSKLRIIIWRMAKTSSKCRRIENTSIRNRMIAVCLATAPASYPPVLDMSLLASHSEKRTISRASQLSSASRKFNVLLE